MIEIDPNIRCRHNHTFTYLDDTTGLRVGDAHVVYQPEMGVAWAATLVEVGDDGFVEFELAWDKWKRIEEA